MRPNWSSWWFPSLSSHTDTHSHPLQSICIQCKLVRLVNHICELTTHSESWSMNFRGKTKCYLLLQWVASSVVLQWSYRCLLSAQNNKIFSQSATYVWMQYFHWLCSTTLLLFTVCALGSLLGPQQWLKLLHLNFGKHLSFQADGRHLLDHCCKTSKIIKFWLFPYCSRRKRIWQNHGVTSSDCRNSSGQIHELNMRQISACRSIWSHLNTDKPTHIPRQHISTDCFIVAKPWRLKYGTDYKILALKI